MFKKHQNYTYIKNRLKQMWYEKKHPDAPWLTKDAIALMSQLIVESDIGLEFGSGRSTKWLAKRCKYLYSVENNQLWYDRVSVEIKNFENVQYYFGDVNSSDPVSSEYLSVLNSLNNNAVDFILNDGKIRDYVAIRSIDKLKPGGLFILDNAERYLPNKLKLPASIRMDTDQVSVEWNKFIDLTNSWRRIWTTDGVSSTLILFKP